MVKNLKLLREEKGISQQKLADMLEITQQAVYKYEKTSVEPDIHTLIKIAEIFGVTVDYLIGRTEEREYSIPEDEKTVIDVLSNLSPESRIALTKFLKSINK